MSKFIPKKFYEIDSQFYRSSERLNLHDYFSRQGKFTHFFESFIFFRHSKTMAILMQWSSFQKAWVNLCQKRFIRSTLGLIDHLRGLTCMIIFHVKAVPSPGFLDNRFRVRSCASISGCSVAKLIPGARKSIYELFYFKLGRFEAVKVNCFLYCTPLTRVETLARIEQLVLDTDAGKELSNSPTDV